VWCDLNYWMADPPMLEACRRRGVAFQGGLDMLVHQGALAFERFTGRAVDPAHVRKFVG
jgi:shikimate 5-dehydrogenase